MTTYEARCFTDPVWFRKFPLAIITKHFIKIAKQCLNAQYMFVLSIVLSRSAMQHNARTDHLKPRTQLKRGRCRHTYTAQTTETTSISHQTQHTLQLETKVMDSEHTANRVPSVSPIPTTLKRKRGPSISGDPPSGKPVLKQSKDASADALADLDELEEVDDEEYDSDSSGNNNFTIRA